MKIGKYFSAAFAISLSHLALAENLPDMIRCNQNHSNYQLVLVLRSPQLPQDVSAIGLKKGAAVIFKVSSQLYKDENGLLVFAEAPASARSKEAKLNLQTKTATLHNFRLSDLSEGASFNCQF